MLTLCRFLQKSFHLSLHIVVVVVVAVSVIIVNTNKFFLSAINQKVINNDEIVSCGDSRPFKSRYRVYTLLSSGLCKTQCACMKHEFKEKSQVHTALKRTTVVVEM